MASVRSAYPLPGASETVDSASVAVAPARRGDKRGGMPQSVARLGVHAGASVNGRAPIWHVTRGGILPPSLFFPDSPSQLGRKSAVWGAHEGGASVAIK